MAGIKKNLMKFLPDTIEAVASTGTIIGTTLDVTSTAMPSILANALTMDAHTTSAVSKPKASKVIGI